MSLRSIVQDFGQPSRVPSFAARLPDRRFNRLSEAIDFVHQNEKAIVADYPANYTNPTTWVAML